MSQKTFNAKHLIFKNRPPIAFTETTGPTWLTSEDTVKGSTMDNRWFWRDHILTLGVGMSVETDFYKITRTK